MIRTLRGEPGKWEDDDILCASAVLAAAVLARVPRTRRALHALLDDRATEAQVREHFRIDYNIIVVNSVSDDYWTAGKSASASAGGCVPGSSHPHATE